MSVHEPKVSENVHVRSNNRDMHANECNVFIIHYHVQQCRVSSHTKY